MAYSPIVNAFRLTSEEAGGQPKYRDVLNDVFSNVQNAYKTAYTPSNLAEALLQAKLKNKHDATINDNLQRSEDARIGGQELGNYAQKIRNEFLPESERVRIDATKAGTGLNQANTYAQNIRNQFLPESERARIKQSEAQAQYYKQGGYGGSTGSKDYAKYQNGVEVDNPNLTPEQAREAATVYAHGGNQLADGTKLAPLSFETESALNRAVKSQTTAAQINQGLLANQADAELKVFSDLTSKWSKPYGETYFGKSPQQIMDSFKDDDKSQTQLGELIASNAGQFEIAQIRNRIAQGAPGITSTNQLMEESRQYIDANFPRLSAKAREVASDRLNYLVQQGLKARNKVGINPSFLVAAQHTSEDKYHDSELVVVEGPNGRETMTYAKAKELGAI